MTNLLSNVWSWVTGKPEMPEIPANILFEKDVSADNDFWIACILDPTLEIKYVNGHVTRMLDTDKCLINDKYSYQPKTEKEIRNFPYIEVNSSVRISLYRKKNSTTEWLVASCFLSVNPCHQVRKDESNEMVRVHVDNNKQSPQITESNTDEKKGDMSVKVVGEMPKHICFEHESTIKIIFKNNSYDKEQELLDYKTMQGNKVQLSIDNKIKLPKIIGLQSEYIFDINIKGKYIGKSTEKVEFIFKDMTYKVGINIDVIDSRINIPLNSLSYSRQEINLQKLVELQNDTLVPGVYGTKRIQFPNIKLAYWNIPAQLLKCFSKENGNYNYNLIEIGEKIEKFYPISCEVLTYHNYRAKFHILLFMEEIQIMISLQKYAKERINFEHIGEYLVLKITDLSEQRPSLIPGDRVAVTDPPNCTKRLGDTGRYEGIIHKVLANEIWLKFDQEFHNICGHWDYSVHFFNTRTTYRKQHEVVNELWKKYRLGESFLFPFKDTLVYQSPKLEIRSLNDKNILSNNCINNLNKDNKTLIAPPKVVQQIKWFNEQLNHEQKIAVINILKGEGRPMPYIIYGPPGTGKTITLTESVIQVYKEFPKSRILLCAPTNFAVDMLLDKMINSGLFNTTVMKRVVGYNYYISPAYNMDYDEFSVLPEFEDSNAPDQKSDPNSKLIRKKELLKLRIVICTEGTAGLLYMMGLKSGTFTHIFIDEAGQTTEPEILLPLSLLDPYRDGQVVLAGDPKQLGPVVMSPLANKNGLGISMLSRFINYPSYQRDTNIFPEYSGYNPKVITHLIRNYRSLPEIVNNFSKLFYNSLLVPTKLGDDIPERVLLKNLNENTHWDIECTGPIIVHGIMGIDSQEPTSPSWFNPHEAFQVLLYVTRLLKAGIEADDIGIITPYASQVSKINELLKMYYPDVKLPKVGTVEMFQGQERMIIIISIVRSKSKVGQEKDKQFNIGFLAAKERTNVALSRAKALVIVIGDPTTLSMNYQWKYVLTQAIKNNNYIGCNIPEYSNVIDHP